MTERDTLRALNNLAGTVDAQGDLPGARASIEEVMAAVGRGEMKASDVARAMYPDYKEERAAAVAQPKAKTDGSWFGLKMAKAVKFKMPKWVRGPQDFVGGIALMAIAAFALWASSDLQGMHGFSFGAGTVPRMFSVLLLGLGAAVTAMGSNVMYCASKAAVDNMTKSLARALAPRIRVVSISPGLVETDFIKSMDQRWRDEQLERTPLKRLTSPNEVAAAVVVAVKNLTFTTGSIIAIDGGRPLS